MIIKYYYGENADEFEFETDCVSYLNLFSKKELEQLVGKAEESYELLTREELVQLISEREDLEELLDVDKVKEFYTDEAEMEYGDMILR